MACTECATKHLRDDAVDDERNDRGNRQQRHPERPVRGPGQRRRQRVADTHDRRVNTDVRHGDLRSRDKAKICAGGGGSTADLVMLDFARWWWHEPRGTSGTALTA